ncbi:cellular morphogenesis protein [Kalaharituber pfeilii]|nr:cellular morphogenesis protein [Kalaharituber pfeilii]
MRKPLIPKSTISLSQLWSLTIGISTVASALEFKAVTPPPLNLDELGKVGLAGDFNGISIYSYEGQQVSALANKNGSDSVMVQLPNGAFTAVVSADANIDAMCTFEKKDGKVVGVVVGGNFTSLGGVEANGVALVNPSDGTVTSMNGLNGKVSALYCDKDTETVYVGGEFTGVNSSNALAWSDESNWEDLPFEGFNKPVKSITKSSSGSIIFGGLFDGLGNVTAPASSHMQTLNLQSAVITAEQTILREGFNDPRNIVCNNGQDGPGNTWLLSDGQFGSWTADFRFGFRPTKLRLRNTHFEGRGTAEFRLTAFPIGGIMNLTYVDPADNQKKFCESRCPLSDDPKVGFQDFEFVNVIGMSNIRIDISRFYGPGAGLAGIEVFQDDVYTFAINDFNEPSCAKGTFASNSEVQGPWVNTIPRGQTNSEYLTANVQGEQTDPLSVTFYPDVQTSGNYSVLIFTPGCIQDGTCGFRGRVNISGIYARDQEQPIYTELFQTNNFDKYDIIYTAYVDAADERFRPSVTLTASVGQTGPLTVVAQKVRFDLISNTTTGLNGIYEYVPGTTSLGKFSDSTIIKSTEKLKAGAQVFTLANKDATIYAAGNFTSKSNNDGFNNIYAINQDGPVSLAKKGLNGVVLTILTAGDNKLYVGGDFTNTQDSDTPGLNKVAIYDTESNTWSALGAGVNGRVKDIVPLKLTVSEEELDVIAVSGDFTELVADENKEAVATTGFGIWVPSKNEWLARLDVAVISLEGNLSATTSVPGGDQFFAGSVLSQDMLAFGAVTVESEDTITLKSLPLRSVPETESNSTIQKRSIPFEQVEGVVTGAFYQEGPTDLTIVGGKFTVEGKDGPVQNLAIIDHNSSDEITGLVDFNATGAFATLHIHSGILYAGGSIEGSVGGFDVSGIVLYDLENGNLSKDQPAGLRGDDPVVYSISTQPDSDRVFIAGSFDSAGSFSCPAICVYETSNRQWTRPGVEIDGTIYAMQWINVNELLVVGNLIINDTATYVAKFDAKNLFWSSVAAGDKPIPGPVTSFAFDSAAGDSLFIAGNTTEGAPFLMKWTGSTLVDLSDGFSAQTIIRGIQVITLKEDHDSNEVLKDDHILLVTGSIELPNIGTFSGVLYDGNNWTPFLITSNSDGEPSSISSMFTQRQQTFTTSGGKMRKGFVILIALAIALGLVFLIVVLGVLASYIRRRREGYQPAPTMILEKSASIQGRVPPAFLFHTVGANNPPNAPTL